MSCSPLAIVFPPALIYTVGILTFLVACFLILLILIQRGKGGGLSGAFGGAGGQSAFGARAGDTVMYVTICVAGVWIGLCVLGVWMLNNSDALRGEAPPAGLSAPNVPGADQLPPVEGAGEETPAAPTGE